MNLEFGEHFAKYCWQVFLTECAVPVKLSSDKISQQILLIIRILA